MVEGPQFTRFYTHLGKTSSDNLKILLEKVDDFVRKTKDSTKNEILQLDVDSYALKRQLARDISNKYKEQGNIYTEFKKNSNVFTIKKWFKKNTNSRFSSHSSTPQNTMAGNPEERSVEEAKHYDNLRQL